VSIGNGYEAGFALSELLVVITTIGMMAVIQGVFTPGADRGAKEGESFVKFLSYICLSPPISI